MFDAEALRQQQEAEQTQAQYQQRQADLEALLNAARALKANAAMKQLENLAEVEQFARWLDRNREYAGEKNWMLNVLRDSAFKAAFVLNKLNNRGIASLTVQEQKVLARYFPHYRLPRSRTYPNLFSYPGF